MLARVLVHRSLNDWSLGMPHCAMTADAGKLLIRCVPFDTHNKAAVAFSAGIFGDFSIIPFYPYRLFEIAGRKGEAMPKTVVGFRQVFANDIFWRMAVVAGGHSMMAGSTPGGVMIAHDVAVCTGRRVVSEIGSPLCIDESIGANA